MQVSTKRYMDLNCSKKERKRNHHYKLNNFQLFKKGHSNMTTALKKDLVIYSDLSLCIQNEICNDNCVIHNKIKSTNEIKIYSNGKCWNKKFENKKKKAISGKHYSYDRYLAKKKGMVMHKMISDNKNYLTKMQKVDNNFNTIGYKNKLNNPCTWSPNYKKNMNYGNQPKDKKYPNFKLSLPTGPAGVKSCKIRNCQKLGKA